ncbi:MAG: hypothetical protein AABX01_00775 [Candidatus Micrarchaeota archaeon]
MKIFTKLKKLTAEVVGYGVFGSMSQGTHSLEDFLGRTSGEIEVHPGWWSASPYSSNPYKVGIILKANTNNMFPIGHWGKVEFRIIHHEFGITEFGDTQNIFTGAGNLDKLKSAIKPFVEQMEPLAKIQARRLEEKYRRKTKVMELPEIT